MVTIDCILAFPLQLSLAADPVELQRVLEDHSILLRNLLPLPLLPLDLLEAVLAPLVLVLAQLNQMHLVWSVDDPHGATLSVHVGEWGVLRYAGAAVSLDGAVEDGQQGVWDKDLGLGDFLEGELGVLGVDHDGGVEDTETGGINLNARAGDALEHHAVLGKELAEGFLAVVVDACEEVFECFLGLLIVVSMIIVPEHKLDHRLTAPTLLMAW